jgi:phosphohistidine phosphatase
MDGMQHTLIVMRHAKAGELPGGPDFDRPLKPRGRRDSAAAGKWLAGHGLEPEAVICSPAVRTRQTWEYLSASLGTASGFSADPGLYRADAQDVAETIRLTPEEVRTLMYIGHNPAAADLVGLLTGAEPDFPTAAIAVVAVPGNWAGLSAGDSDLLTSWTPRS